MHINHEDTFESDLMTAEIMATSGCDYDEARYHARCEIKKSKWDNDQDETGIGYGMTIYQM